MHSLTALSFLLTSLISFTLSSPLKPQRRQMVETVTVTDTITTSTTPSSSIPFVPIIPTAVPADLKLSLSVVTATPIIDGASMNASTLAPVTASPLPSTTAAAGIIPTAVPTTLVPLRIIPPAVPSQGASSSSSSTIITPIIPTSVPTTSNAADRERCTEYCNQIVWVFSFPLPLSTLPFTSITNPSSFPPSYKFQLLTSHAEMDPPNLPPKLPPSQQPNPTRRPGPPHLAFPIPLLHHHRNPNESHPPHSQTPRFRQQELPTQMSRQCAFPPPTLSPAFCGCGGNLADDGVIDGSQILPLAMRNAEILAGPGARDGVVARQLATLYQQILEKCML